MAQCPTCGNLTSPLRLASRGTSPVEGEEGGELGALPPLDGEGPAHRVRPLAGPRAGSGRGRGDLRRSLISACQYYSSSASGAFFIEESLANTASASSSSSSFFFSSAAGSFSVTE